MVDISTFTDEQKKFVASMIRDFGGPTCTSNILAILRDALNEAAPDWEIDPSAFSGELRQDIESCMAALAYFEISNI